MGITHVMRGEDLLNVTPKVLLLRQALGITDDAGVRPPAADRRTSSARSCRSGTTTSSVEEYQRPAATCPRRWSTTWPCSAGAPPDGVEIRPIAEIVELFRARGRHQVAAPSSTSRSSTTSTASTSGRCRSTSSSRAPSRGSCARRRAVAARALRRRPSSRRWPRWCRSGCKTPGRGAGLRRLPVPRRARRSTRRRGRRSMVKGRDRRRRDARRHARALRHVSSGPRRRSTTPSRLSATPTSSSGPRRRRRSGWRSPAAPSARPCSSRSSCSAATTHRSTRLPRPAPGLILRAGTIVIRLRRAGCVDRAAGPPVVGRARSSLYLGVPSSRCGGRRAKTSRHAGAGHRRARRGAVQRRSRRRCSRPASITPSSSTSRGLAPIDRGHRRQAAGRPRHRGPARLRLPPQPGRPRATTSRSRSTGTNSYEELARPPPLIVLRRPGIDPGRARVRPVPLYADRRDRRTRSASTRTVLARQHVVTP